jgi:hypothetical protein
LKFLASLGRHWKQHPQFILTFCWQKLARGFNAEPGDVSITISTARYTLFREFGWLSQSRIKNPDLPHINSTTLAVAFDDGVAFPLSMNELEQTIPIPKVFSA